MTQYPLESFTVTVFSRLQINGLKRQFHGFAYLLERIMTDRDWYDIGTLGRCCCPKPDIILLGSKDCKEVWVQHLLVERMRWIEDTTYTRLKCPMTETIFLEDEVVPFILTPLTIGSIHLDLSYPVGNDGLGCSPMDSYQIPQHIGMVMDVIIHRHNDIVWEIAERWYQFQVRTHIPVAVANLEDGRLGNKLL